jgi:hypothetical protein
MAKPLIIPQKFRLIASSAANLSIVRAPCATHRHDGRPRCQN